MPLASDRVAKLPNSRSSESEKLPRALQNEKGISYSKLQEEYNKLLFKKHQVWCRSFVIPKAFVGLSFQVHNGSKFVLLQVTEKIVGYRFGEFVPTRKVTVHKEVKKKK
jgi:ribosomal protein S19